MCVLPPKTNLDYVTQSVLTTIPPSVNEDSILRRSNEAGSYNGRYDNKKVCLVLRVLSNLTLLISE